MTGQALAAARKRTLEPIVEGRHIIVCTGAGGVGKTTTAASLAIAAAERGRRTIVLTIDPARRLAQSLGLQELDNTPREVAGIDGLDAMMLDMKRTFDEVIERHADSAGRVERIKANRFYQQLSNSLAGTQEYMAMEKLYDLHVAGRYDCIVIDTPPTRNALDFLDAPKRLTSFLEGRFLRMFLAPGMAAGKLATRAVGFGTGLFMRAASRLTGQEVLSDLAEFFQAFEGMYDGFKRRALAVYKLLQSSDSAFVVVSSPEEPPLREARYFLQRLASDGMPTAGLVVNRVTRVPAEVTKLRSDAARKGATRLDAGGTTEQAVAELLRFHADRLDVARRERHNIEAALHGLDPHVLAEVPLLPTDVYALDDLKVLGQHLL